LGVVALDIFILLNNITSGLNVCAYIKTDEVLAVPDPPTKRIALLHNEDLG